MSWDEKSVARLRELWDQGYTGSQIARIIAAEFNWPPTRNAIIGKVHRLGLSSRPSVIKREVQPPPVTRKISPPKTSQPAVIQPEAPPRPRYSGPVTKEKIREGQCRWPIGDPAERSFRFCGQPVNRRPYCDEHRRMAFQPLNDRRERAGRATVDDPDHAA